MVCRMAVPHREAKPAFPTLPLDAARGDQRAPDRDVANVSPLRAGPQQEPIVCAEVNRPGVRGDFWPWKTRMEFMASENAAGRPTTRRYSMEEKQAAVRMVRSLRAELGQAGRR
jgi:hypothetical protein